MTDTKQTHAPNFLNPKYEYSLIVVLSCKCPHKGMCRGHLKNTSVHSMAV